MMKNSRLTGFRLTFLVAASAFMAIAISSELFGQAERLELGRRLKRFETAWETADTSHRTTCVRPMQAAVNSFFGLQLSTAGKHLDEAWQIARAVEAVDDVEKFCVSRQLLVSPVCSDVVETKLEIKLSPFYKTDVSPVEDMRIVLALADANDAVVATDEFTLADLLDGRVWDIGVIPEGDYRLRVQASSAAGVFAWPVATISRINRFEERLSQLEQAIAKPSDAIDLVTRVSVRNSVNVLRSMQDGAVQEIDYPALARLEMCEAMFNSGEKPAEVILSLARKSDVWLALAKDRSSVAVRLRAPAESAALMPVLFVFHGAGGSENMFFETYGAGRVVEEGLQRGWLVVAPRQGLFGLGLDVKEMLDLLDPIFRIDRTQVMLLGHSMGAAQVVRQATLHPDLPIAAVALGGGSRVSQAPQLKTIPWFVGAGSEDFGKRGAVQLHNSLEAATVSSEYHEYANVEHMVIVQAAIDDVFQFLDKIVVPTASASSELR